MDAVPSSSMGLYLASVLLGLSVAAPIGPINVEIIRRGLTQSWRSAFALGCGAVTADCCYFGLALVGASVVTRLGESGVAGSIGLILGGSMLTWLGVGALRGSRRIQAPPKAVSPEAVQGGEVGEASVPRTYGLGLVLTLANPMTIALWLSIAAGLSAAASSEPGMPVVRLAGVGSGALSWVCFVTTLTAWARRWINPTMMRGVNLASGVILIGYGLWFYLKLFPSG